MTVKLKPLDQQVIVITGASSGIGLVTAESAAKQGARVLLVARSEDALAEVVARITAAGGTADYKVADVGDAAQVRSAAAHAVQRFGRIDTWVNDAGVAIYGRLLDTPDHEHEQLMRTNYFGVVHGCEAAVPLLREHGGALITVASVAADMATPLMGAYAASKHAVKAYVETLRIELAQDDAPISVSIIKPSGIDTPVAEHAPNHAGGRAQLPPPVYDPQLVADAILHCATHVRREITVGGSGKAQVLLAAHAPQVYDKLAGMASTLFTDPTRSQPGPDNLFSGARAGHARSQDQHGRKTSFYTTLSKQRGWAALVIGAAAGGAAWAASRRKATTK